MALDVIDKESNKAAAKVVEEKLGYLDVVIANAGTNFLNYLCDIFSEYNVLIHRSIGR